MIVLPWIGSGSKLDQNPGFGSYQFNVFGSTTLVKVGSVFKTANFSFRIPRKYFVPWTRQEYKTKTYRYQNILKKKNTRDNRIWPNGTTMKRNSIGWNCRWILFLPSTDSIETAGKVLAVVARSAATFSPATTVMVVVVEAMTPTAASLVEGRTAVSWSAAEPPPGASRGL